jgi:hypothetical protein
MIVVPMTNTPRRTYPLGAPATLLCSRMTVTGVEVQLPSVTPDPSPTVLVVEIAEAAPTPTPFVPDGGAVS